MRVANLPAAYKLGILQSVFDAVTDGDFPDILTAIKSFQKSGMATVSGGQTILSVAGGGYSTTFAAPGTYSAQELFGFWAELRTVHDSARAALIAAGTAAPTQPEIYAEMAADDYFQRITSTQGDYTMLRAGGGW